MLYYILYIPDIQLYEWEYLCNLILGKWDISYFVLLSQQELRREFMVEVITLIYSANCICVAKEKCEIF